MTVTHAARLTVAVILLPFPFVRAEDPPTLDRAAAEYASTARPLLAKYCLECHSTEAMEGDLDLERFAALGDVRKATGVWLKVAEMLDNGEMPPKEARRLPARERQALRGWLGRLPQGRGPRRRRRPRARRPAAAEQRRVHLHAPRPDRRARSTRPASSPSTAPPARGSPTRATPW